MSDLASGKASFAHRAAGLAGRLSPWWRFRVWARLAGRDAYASFPDRIDRPTPVWPHFAVMDLRRGDWMERYAHDAGRFYQDDLIHALMRLVEPGSTFVDIGANLGFVTLTASMLVGPRGKVISVEANTDLVERLSRTLARNGVTNVELHSAALGDRNGEASLETDDHHGTSHLAFDQANGRRVTLRRGDDLIGDPQGPIFAKLDVEGAELMVLHGLPKLVARQDATWLIEICERQLSRFGASAEHIFALMEAAGYVALAPTLSPFSSRLRLKPLTGPQQRPLYDVLFTRPASGRA